IPLYEAGYPRVTHPSAAQSIRIPSENFLQIASLDLHVLGTPPAFILSQDQTLMLKVLIGSKFRLANFQPYPFTWFRSEFFSNPRSKPDLLVLRIFRVLHTV